MGGAGWVAEKFDRRAPSYDQSVPHRWQARRAVEFLAPAWGQRLLDVATGTGLAAREAASLIGPDGLVVGADVSMGMLRAARQAAGETRCRFAQADAAAENDNPIWPHCDGLIWPLLGACLGVSRHG